MLIFKILLSKDLTLILIMKLIQGFFGGEMGLQLPDSVPMK